MGISSMSSADPHLLDPLHTVDEKAPICYLMLMLDPKMVMIKVWFSASNGNSSFDFI